MSTDYVTPQFAFPNAAPGRWRIPPDFELWPDSYAEGAQPKASLPATPPIPPTVNTGDIISSQHENTTTTALQNLWTNEQWIATQLNAASIGAVPSTRQVLAGAGMSGGGALSADVTLSALVTSVMGRQGAVVLQGSDVSGAGGVLTTRLINAGAGLSGGGALSADVTLTANVQTVFGRTGAVVLQASDLSGAGGVLNTRQVIAGAGMTGGGPLSADVTLNAKVTSVAGRTGDVVLTPGDVGGVPTSRQVIAGAGLSGGGPLTADVTLTAVAMGASGAAHSAGMVPDPGATAGTAKYLREDGSWQLAPVVSVFGRTGAVLGAIHDYTAAMVDNAVDKSQFYADPPWLTQLNYQKIVGATLIVDPTTTVGDLLVRGATAPPTRLGTGGAASDGQVLTADSTQALGMRWAAPTGASGGYTTVQDEGTARAQRSILNFVGAGVTAADDAANVRTTVTIPGGAAQTPWAQDVNAAGFRLLSAGFIGIGTASPGAPLTVLGSANTNVLRVCATSPANSWFYVTPEEIAGHCGVGYWNGSAYGTIFIDRGVNFGVGSQPPATAFDVWCLAGQHVGIFNSGNLPTIGAFNDGFGAWQPLNINPSNNVYMCSTSGRVGIGTTAPSVALDVVGLMLLEKSSQPVFRMADTSVADPNGRWSLYVNGSSYFSIFQYTSTGFATGSDRLIINQSGNVGIGTTTANAKLTLGNNVPTAPFASAYTGYQVMLYDSGAPAGSYGFGIEGGNLCANTGGGFRFYSNATSTPMVQIGWSAQSWYGLGIGLVGVLPPGWCAFVTNSSGAGGAGLGVGWNKISGNGETDFYNFGQGGPGGFGFWNFYANGSTYPTTNSPSILMYLDNNGYCGHGTQSPQCPVDSVGMIRSTGNVNSLSSGSGIMMYFGTANNVGIIRSMSGGAGAWLGTWIEGNPLCMNVSSGGVVAIGTNTPVTSPVAAQLTITPCASTGTQYARLHCITTVTNGYPGICLQTDSRQWEWGAGSSASSYPGWFYLFDRTAGAGRLCVNPTGYHYIGGLTSASYWLQIVADSAAKPSTSSWTVASDEKLKRNIQPVEDDSLSIIEALEWIRFQYNGLAGMPKDDKCIGLSAQKLRSILPEAVGSVKMALFPHENGAPDREVIPRIQVEGYESTDEVADILDISYHHVLVHAARAIAQLSARVRQLEGRH
jgi:hypothetical protein